MGSADRRSTVIARRARPYEEPVERRKYVARGRVWHIPEISGEESPFTSCAQGATRDMGGWSSRRCRSRRQAALSVRAIDWERHWVRRSSNWFRISSAGWATCAALACAGGLPGGMWRVRLQTGALQEANSHVV
jgi:hypothetical protein